MSSQMSKFTGPHITGDGITMAGFGEWRVCFKSVIIQL